MHRACSRKRSSYRPGGDPCRPHVEQRTHLEYVQNPQTASQKNANSSISKWPRDVKRYFVQHRQPAGKREVKSTPEMLPHTYRNGLSQKQRRHHSGEDVEKRSCISGGNGKGPLLKEDVLPIQRSSGTPGRFSRRNGNARPRKTHAWPAARPLKPTGGYSAACGIAPNWSLPQCPSLGEGQTKGGTSTQWNTDDSATKRNTLLRAQQPKEDRTLSWKKPNSKVCVIHVRNILNMTRYRDGEQICGGQGAGQGLGATSVCSTRDSSVA